MNYTGHMANIISDPFDGPFEGEDFCIDDQGYIQVTNNNVKLAALILRKVNTSNIFPKKLIKIGSSGDSILLGFDDLSESNSVHTDNIGPNNETKIQVRKDDSGKFFVYVNDRRSARPLKSMTSVKKFIKNLDQELNQIASVPEESFED